jgi:ABC-type molybdate transport system substrate-binding protein
MVRCLIFLCLAALLQLPVAAAEVPRPAQKANLTILSDENMLMPLAQLVRLYAAHTNTPLTVVLKHAEEASAQIEQGLEAHLIITANAPLINRLTEQGLTDVTSRRGIARSPLALVTASELGKEAFVAKRISFAAILNATPDLPVFVDTPESYAGARAQALLTDPEFAALLGTRLIIKADHEEMIEALRDSNGLALMLAADAATETDIKVLALLPETLSPPVLFEGVVLGSESMGDAKELLNYLDSREAQRVFARFGFQPSGN